MLTETQTISETDIPGVVAGLPAFSIEVILISATILIVILLILIGLICCIKKRKITEQEESLECDDLEKLFVVHLNANHNPEFLREAINPVA